jgi:hypothetical protein
MSTVRLRAQTSDGRKIIGELKTTKPYQPGFGAQQRSMILKDLARLATLPADPHVLPLQQGDDIALQYLGAAVVLQWENLPEAARDAIWQQAESVGGLPPVTSLHEQLKSLIRRTKR